MAVVVVTLCGGYGSGGAKGGAVPAGSIIEDMDRDKMMCARVIKEVTEARAALDEACGLQKQSRTKSILYATAQAIPAKFCQEECRVAERDYAKIFLSMGKCTKGNKNVWAEHQFNLEIVDNMINSCEKISGCGVAHEGWKRLLATCDFDHRGVEKSLQVGVAVKGLEEEICSAGQKCKGSISAFLKSFDICLSIQDDALVSTWYALAKVFQKGLATCDEEDRRSIAAPSPAASSAQPPKGAGSPSVPRPGDTGGKKELRSRACEVPRDDLAAMHDECAPFALSKGEADGAAAIFSPSSFFESIGSCHASLSTRGSTLSETNSQMRVASRQFGTFSSARVQRPQKRIAADERKRCCNITAWRRQC